jgi:hypothetical protein
MEADLREIRRLILERDAKKQEMDALDLALRKAVGLDMRTGSRKKSLSENDFIALCGGPRRERLSKAK